MPICIRQMARSFPGSPRNPVCQRTPAKSACRYLATVIAALIHGEDRDEALSPEWQPLQRLNNLKPLNPLIQEIAQGRFRQKQSPAVQESGWAVNLGDNADTTGAICGQLAGANRAFPNR